MAEASSDPCAAAPASAPLALKKENVAPVNTKLKELDESRSELLNKIQGLKHDLQSWRTKLDSQVQVYRDELSELKKTLNAEVEQLRGDFKELHTTLHQQQEDVTTSLKNLGLQDVPENAKEPQDQKLEVRGENEDAAESNEEGRKED